MNENFPKFIFVSGGVISGLGKGVTTSFIGAILKSYGYSVTAVKIDPYINIDAGTFSPYEHGEVYVLDDGSEVDLDLGNYERMLDIRLSSDNNLTTGKVFHSVISNERKGKYLGKTVQIIPHITDEIQMRLLKIANSAPADVLDSKICMVEIGGTIGDMEMIPFIEAIRQFQTKIGIKNFCHVHISLIPQTTDGEQKTKPTQSFVRIMKSQGLNPDLIFCRSKTEVDQNIKNKISLFCDIPSSNIISLPDLENMYLIIPLLLNQKIADHIFKRLDLPDAEMNQNISKWFKISEMCTENKIEISIAIVGKYIIMKDAYYSIISSLVHASLHRGCKVKIEWINSEFLEPSHENTSKTEYEKAWKNLRESKGVIIPGGFDFRGVEGKILAINYCRINKIPLLGICLGFQAMIIEFARNVLNLPNANSMEFNSNTIDPVVIEMPEFNPIHKGASMRLGLRKTILTHHKSISKKLYNSEDCVYERHRHRYEFNIKYFKSFEEKGFIFAGHDETGLRMEIGEISEKNHPFFVGVQYHPEFISRPTKPSPLFLGLVNSVMNLNNQNK